jgi:hypothetical protein
MKLNKKKIQKPIFIISSGRTGSTLISKILNKHKDICIISDLIEPVGNNKFLEKNTLVTQKFFFDLISRRTSLSRIYFWRKKKTKELLYLPKKDKNVSCLNCYTIPFVFNNVKATFNQLKNKFNSKKIQKKKSDHLIDFFNFFLKKTKKKIYVERTGGALHHIDKIINFYPDAKIILNLRNPLETAISMRNYPFFRMYELMLKNKKLIKWDLDKKKSYQTYGVMLNQWYKKFFLVKKKIKDKNFFYYNYEDLVLNPEKTLKKIILFILDKKKDEKYLTNFSKKHAKYIQENKPKFFKLKKNDQKLLKRSLGNSLSMIKNIDNKIITKYKI